MNIRTIRRAFSAAALAATAALAVPGAAIAAPATPVSIEIGKNTATFTITVNDSDDNLECSGPWIHTESDAKAILGSPTLDVAKNARNWFVGTPVSPIGGVIGMNPDASWNWVSVSRGQVKSAKIPYIADGRYVAGTSCLQPVGDGYKFILVQTPFTVGAPTSAAGGTGSLGSLAFGS